MDNNFENRNDLNKNIENSDVDENSQSLPTEVEEQKAENTPTEAEHVISYRTDDTHDTAPAPQYFNNLNRGEGHTSQNRDAYPAYSAPHRTEDGSISYTPVTAQTQPKKKKHGTGVLVAVLVVAGMFLSVGCGMLGAFIGNEIDMETVNSTQAQDTGKGSEDSVVVYKAAEIENSVEGETMSYSQVESVAGDSVVAISTEYKNQGLWEYITEGAGSGVVMSEDGYIITNNHVVCRNDSNTTYADGITVTMKNGDEYGAEVIGGDPSADIAVIKVELEEGEKLTAAVFADSDKLAVGEEVIAIGNPLGELSGTVTNGIISALAREISVEGVTMNLLQTNAAINPGNSGGGLFNMNGQLIGVVNAKSSGTGIEGLGFAIPANDALETAEAIIENGGSVTKPAVKIGITTYNVLTSADARKYGFNALGVYIIEVEKGYNDDVLKSGDRIIAVDGNEITQGSDIVSIVKEASAGDKLEFMVYRDGRFMTVEVTCYDANGDTSSR